MSKKRVVLIIIVFVGIIAFAAFGGNGGFQNGKSNVVSPPTESQSANDTSYLDYITNYFTENETTLNEIKDMIFENTIGFQMVLIDNMYSVYPVDEKSLTQNDIKNFDAIGEQLTLLSIRQTFYDPAQSYCELSLTTYNPIGESFVYNENDPSPDAIGIWTPIAENWYYVQYLHV